MRILREDVRQGIDTIAALAEAVHASHSTKDDWRHCGNPRCVRACRVATRLEGLLTERKRVSRQNRLTVVGRYLEGMIG